MNDIWHRNPVYAANWFAAQTANHKLQIYFAVQSTLHRKPPTPRVAEFSKKVLDLFNNPPYHIYRLACRGVVADEAGGLHSMAHKIGQPKIPKR